MKKNMKGFTLIELLAVIVILAILVAVAIPSVTRYLNDAREGSFQNEASSLVETARTYIIANNITTSGTFSFEVGGKNAVWTPTGGNGVNVNNVVEKTLKKSPYGNNYQNGYVFVEYTVDNNGVGSYEITMSDGTYCFVKTGDSSINETTPKNEDCPKAAANNG